VEAQGITVPLDLPDLRVLAQRVTATALEVEVQRATTSAVCPQCGHRTAKRHDIRPRRLLYQPVGERTVTLILHRRRFRCWPCDRVFTEPDTVAGPRRRLTGRLRQQLGRQGCTQPVTVVAARHGVSPATVGRAVTEYAAPRLADRAATPVVQLGIDDFSLRRGRRYATGLHDLVRRTVVDVVEGRTAAVAQAALERLPAPEVVQVVSMDMARAYRAAVQVVLPDAVIVVDKYHVIARIHKALAQVWGRLLRGRARDDPVRTDGRLVFTARETLTEEQRARLGAVLWQHPDLRRAWLLKEDFRRWYRDATAPDARLELRAWLRTAVHASNLPEFAALTGMFREWQEEILAYFTHRVTQALVEGHNTRAKCFQRQAYGYRRVESLRTRLMVAT
jgi:transposase